MKYWRILSLVAITAAGLVGAGGLVGTTTSHAEEWVGHTVKLAGRNIRCGNAEIMLDNNLPSEGGAGDDFLILNPMMINRQPKAVRLFVFSHECGHLVVGDSELEADCFGVKRGVQEGWLDRKGLKQVCQSFEGAPETDTHPSAARRCRHLDRCFATAVAERDAGNAKPTAQSAPVVPPAPRRASEPARKSTISAWRCTHPLPVPKQAPDPIAGLIVEDAKTAPHCQ